MLPLYAIAKIHQPVIAPLFSDEIAEELLMSIKVLWSSLHEICVLLHAGTLEDGDDPIS